jgi:hypothetical protein
MDSEIGFRLLLPPAPQSMLFGRIFRLSFAGKGRFEKKRRLVFRGRPR